MMRILLALLAFACAAGCSGSAGTRPADPSQPRSSKAQPAEPNAVELTLRTQGGPLVFVGDMRGRPLLLFMFATFDGVSQAALRPLEQFVHRHPDAQVVGVAVQPFAERLLDPYVHALSPPFPVAYDPEDRLEKGTTPIGKIEQVPTFVMLDALGRPATRHVGYATLEQLEAMLASALEAVPPSRARQERVIPPLLGEPVE
jgi:hypothetical protein